MCVFARYPSLLVLSLALSLPYLHGIIAVVGEGRVNPPRLYSLFHPSFSSFSPPSRLSYHTGSFITLSLGVVLLHFSTLSARYIPTSFITSFSPTVFLAFDIPSHIRHLPIAHQLLVSFSFFFFPYVSPLQTLVLTPFLPWAVGVACGGSRESFLASSQIIRLSVCFNGIPPVIHFPSRPICPSL